MPYITDATVPYSITGPAIVNILEPTPKINPSDLFSMAHDTTALANPVIGTRVPAPPCLAIFSYRPKPVSIAEINTKVTEVHEELATLSKPIDVYMFNIICPIRHIVPPIKNALTVSKTALDFGETLSLIWLYSCGVIDAIKSPPLRLLLS